METLYIVVPCYNEEEVLDNTVSQLTRLLDRLKNSKKISVGKILFVDDGSKDTTWSIIRNLGANDLNITGLKLAHNVGHQQALWAGMMTIADKTSAIVSIDADLQDDVDSIEVMVDKYNDGFDVVYGVRRERKKDSFFKKYTALGFYRLMQLMGSDIIYNHADFRLLSQRALKALISMPERNLFIRGMIRLVGFRSDIVYYDRKERMAGKSKYPFSKMFHFAVDGITSFSTKPLHWIMMFGFIFIFVSLLVIIYALVEHNRGNTTPGWTSLLVSMWFIGGFLLIAIAIVGEYIGKIYKEVKHRPLYFEEERINL